MKPDRPSRALPPGLAGRLDPVCDRFEAVWIEGGRPWIEFFLAQVDRDDRPALLTELLALEIEYRQRNGEKPRAEEYHGRLPTFAAVINEAFAGQPEEPPPTELLKDTVPPQIGRYQIDSEMARGGMGVIWLARDTELDRELAVKVLQRRHQGTEELEGRFRAEARIMGQLQHPGIPPVYEVGSLPDGRPFFVMKLIRGSTLADKLRQRGSPDNDLAHFLDIFERVCQTLAYAHSRGVIHRDLKPSNVMVGEFGEVQVMDWGLARSSLRIGAKQGEPEPIEEIRTMPGSVLGTPLYMSPEQACGDAHLSDARSDVFSLGAILCEILTGYSPYHLPGESKPESKIVLRRARNAELEQALIRLNESAMERDLLELVLSCLKVNPAHRLADGAAILQRLTAHRAKIQQRQEQETVPPSDTAKQPYHEVDRRKRWWLIATAGVVLLLLIVAILVAVMR